MSPPPLVAPGPDDHHGPALIVGVSILQALSLTLYGARIYSRSVPRLRVWWDDLFITAAILFNLVEYGLMIVSVTYGLGRHNAYVNPPDTLQAEKYLFLSQPFFPWALVFAKISIAVMLLRILGESLIWRCFLYFMIVFQILIAATMNGFQLSLCTPISAVWDHSVPNPVCMSPTVAQASIYATAAATILTDVVLSTVPLTFITQLQRPLREKVAIAVIMGFGIVASCASIYKTTLVSRYGVTGDTLMDGVDLTMWSFVEMQLGIMAACLPALKQLFEKILGRIGLLSSRQRSHRRSGYVPRSDYVHPHRLKTITVATTQASSRGSLTLVSSRDTTSDDIVLPVMKI